MGKKRGKKSFPTDDELAVDGHSKSSQALSDGVTPEIGASAGSWQSLVPPLSAQILNCIRHDFKFHFMTPVQATVIPLLMTHKDVCAQAVTGSGKTLAFAIPTVELLCRRSPALSVGEIGAIVIAPSRELARQISSVFKTLVDGFNGKSDSRASSAATDDDNADDSYSSSSSSHTSFSSSLSVLTLVGGSADLSVDLANFRRHGGSILVGTPGRLLAFLRALPAHRLRTLEIFVLDEADRLLQMGFSETLNDILARLPKQRRTGLFSATQTQELEDLTRAGLRNPVRVAIEVREQQSDQRKSALNSTLDSSVTSSSSSAAAGAVVRATPQSLANFFAVVPRRDKLSVLVRFLARHADCKIIVYSLTCAFVDYLWKALEALWPRRKQSTPQPKRRKKRKPSKASAVAERVLLSLHGKVPQSKRVAVYDQFCASANAILLCTDVAARGLDIPQVDWIVQLDPPHEPDAYVHRVGRTARMGRQGSALILLTPEEDAFVEFLRNRRVPLHQLQLTDNNETMVNESNSDVSNVRAGKNEEDKVAKTPTVAVVVASSPGRRLSTDQLSRLSTDQLSSAFRDLALSDREVMNRAQRAFVSYVRAYKEHRLSFIFPFSKLEFGHLAHSLGLLRMPSMPELRGSAARIADKIVGFQAYRVRTGTKVASREPASADDPRASSATQDKFASVPYRNKSKEKQRQGAIQRSANDTAQGRVVEEETVPPKVSARQRRAALQQAALLKQQRKEERAAERKERKAQETRQLIAAVLEKTRQGAEQNAASFWQAEPLVAEAQLDAAPGGNYEVKELDSSLDVGEKRARSIMESEGDEELNRLVPKKKRKKKKRNVPKSITKIK